MLYPKEMLRTYKRYKELLAEIHAGQEPWWRGQPKRIIEHLLDFTPEAKRYHLRIAMFEEGMGL